MPRLFVLDAPEFRPIVDFARNQAGYRVSSLGKGYFVIEAAEEMVFRRTEMRLKPAIWYGMFTGGLDGQIVHWDRDEVRVRSHS